MLAWSEMCLDSLLYPLFHAEVSIFPWGFSPPPPLPPPKGKKTKLTRLSKWPEYSLRVQIDPDNYPDCYLLYSVHHVWYE